MAYQPPAPQRLRELLDYNPLTGVLVWRVQKGNACPAGTIAGALNKGGYRCIMIDGHSWVASRVAWAIVTGEWPIDKIDHRNNAHADDRWNNLRPATRAQNGANMKLRSDNELGLKGVTRHDKGFRAIITSNRQRINLGTFGSPQLASAIRKWAAVMLHGEYARFA